MTSGEFFDETREQSIVKTTIVTKYFWAWARVVIPSAKKAGNKIAYIDLFAGPGRFKDGTKSTPLLLLEKAIEDRDMCQMLVTLFNDRNEDFSWSLRQAVDALPNVGNLRYPPEVRHFEVGDEIARMFNKIRLVPTLFFVDPWGYKGLSLDLVGSVLKDWGCDCIFFFNYNRINMGLTNPSVVEHMNALFGNARADELREELELLSSDERELLIIEHLSEALRDKGGKYVLPFRFVNEARSRTSHHLIFVSKNIRGYEIMKDIMAGESSRIEQGVPALEYNPADRRFPTLFDLSRPLDELEGMLASEFAGETFTMQHVYRKHNIGTQFIKRNYKDALRNLESRGDLVAEPPAADRPHRQGEVTFADSVVVTFPNR